MTFLDIVNHPTVTIVDVRESYEYNSGHIEGAVNIPLSELFSRKSEFDAMPKPIIVHCLSGGRSGQAAAFLNAQGVTEVYNGGGIGDMAQYKRVVR